MVNQNYDSRFVNSITLCFQGGIEGMHTTFANNGKVKLDKYIIQVVSIGNDPSALKSNMEQLDQMYDNISIVVMCDGKMIYSSRLSLKIKNHLWMKKGWQLRRKNSLPSHLERNLVGVNSRNILFCTR